MDGSKLTIGAYYLSPAASTHQHVRDLAACGIDLVMNMRNDRAALDLLAQNGVGAIVSGIVPGWFGGDGSNAGTMSEKNALEKYDQAADAFVDHPAIWGIDTGDEPSSLDFPHYGAVMERMAKRFPGKMPYLNIYPSYAVKGSNSPQEIVRQLGTQSYAEYIERYVRYVNTPYICFDYYLYSAELAGLYESLVTVSQACRKNGRDMWMVLQVNSHRPEVYISENQLNFQTNCALAFGARAVIWACYCPGWWYNHVLDKDGNKTEQYEKLWRVNARLHCLGEIYVRYRCEETFFVGGFEEQELSASGKTALPLLNTKMFKNIHADGARLLVGQLSQIEGEDEALFIAVADDPSGKDEREIRLTFESEAENVIVANGETQEMLTCGEGGQFSLKIGCCKGLLLRIEE